jgi:glutamate formiminotransferase
VALGQSEIRRWSETSKSDDHAIGRSAEIVDHGAHGGEVRRLGGADNVHAAGIDRNAIEAVSACAAKIRGE